MKASRGFTLVELLIVIVVIAILAAITIVAYGNVTARAQRTKMSADLAQLSQAIQVARNNTGKALKDITGTVYTAGDCTSQPAGTDLAVLDKTNSCWVAYTNALQKISNASGMNVTNMVDPWGRPYFIDENEGEAGGCGVDVIAAYTQPFNASNLYSAESINIPLSGYSGCAT